MSRFTADFGRAADDYATHRAGFPDSLWERLSGIGLLPAGTRVLDLGTGTGTVARALARRGVTVTGLDVSAEMLAQARGLAEADGVSVDWRQGTAEATGLPDAAVDLVTAGQCWHWFDAAAAFAEAARVLAPGGWLAICHFDWLPLPGNVVEATEALIRAHNPDWPYGGGDGFHGRHATAAAVAGYTGIETFTYDLDQPYSHVAWRGRIRASAGVGGTLPPDRVAAFDAEHAALLAERFPQDPLAVPHRVFALVARPPHGRAQG